MKIMEKQKNKEKNLIYLKDLLSREIHFDEVSKFRKSFFSDVYENAVSAVEEIVSDNRRREKIVGERKKDQRIKSVSNVISFIGRRGTGKSSVMMSFQDALRQYTNENYQCQRYNNIIFGKKADMENVRFFSLDYIDASVLEESEDVFILVLANMLSYLYSLKSFSDEYNDNSKRELIGAFERVYEEFLTLKNSRQDREGVYSSFETLLNVASSQRIRERFYKLVQQFIKYIQRTTDERAKECYMVITIDDLDMAHYNTQNSNKTKSKINNKSYEIVNSIHKYFSIPGVIVLTAYNYENLMLQSEKFFIESDRTANDKGHEKESQQMTSSRLASQFVDKVFPPVYRVYLPSWKKNDFGSSAIKVDVVTGIPNENIIEKYVENMEQTLSIKKFVLVLYAEKVGIFFDPFGKKIHFLEPDSLRKIADMVAIFDGVKEQVEDSVDDSEFFYKQKILKKIKEDTYFRFVQEKLFLSEERVYFAELQGQRIDRRSQMIVKDFCGKIPRLGKAITKETERYRANIEHSLLRRGYTYLDYSKINYVVAQKEDNSNVKYSLAEFIHCIYHMTRNSSEKYSKELVSCILNSYTVYLSELFSIYQNEKKKMNLNQYISYINEKTMENKKMSEIQMIFAELIGDSICGKWTEYFFPETYTIVPGAMNVNENRSESVVLGCATITKAANSFTIESRNGKNSNLNERFERVVKACIMMCMFYVDVLNWDSINFVPIVKSENEGGFNSVMIQPPGYLQRIEMTAFMKYSVRYSEFFDKINKLMNKSLKSQENLIDKDQIIKSINKVINEMKMEYIKWDYNYSNMILPIQSLDLTYNMIKRIYQKTSKKNRVVQIDTGEDFLKEVMSMNTLFSEYLDEIDEYYKIDSNLETNVSFADTFKECPFIKWIQSVMKDAEITNSIGYIFRNMIIDCSDKFGQEIGGDDISGAEI